MASDITQNSLPKRPNRQPRSYRIRNRTFLRLKRESRNLSQADLAAFIGVSRSAVAHWESGANGGIAPEHAELISIVLDEPMKALFTVD